MFHATFPDVAVQPGELTVISYVLPQTDATKCDNRKEIFYPSESWARARLYGEEVNVKLRRHLVSQLQSAGHEAIAPQLSDLWERKASERYVFASNWSERHAAYAAGLGTFGLCDGLITPKGKAMRVGSVIANIQIPATKSGLTAIIMPTACFFPMAPVKSASRDARRVPLPKPAMTKLSAEVTCIP